MGIKYYYYPDCPSHEEGLERLKKVMKRLGIDRRIEIICVESEESAEKYGFIGSPTITVDGRDIDEPGLEGQPTALTCRVYRLENGRFSPLPSEEMIERALT